MYGMERYSVNNSIFLNCRPKYILCNLSSKSDSGLCCKNIGELFLKTFKSFPLKSESGENKFTNFAAAYNLVFIRHNMSFYKTYLL